MNKRNFKLFVVPTIYIVTIFIFGTSIFLIQRIVNNQHFENPEEMEYVDKEIVTDNEYIPVVNLTPTIIKPYLSEKVTINKLFYMPDADSEIQEKAIIFYENTYMQNTGVDYKSNEPFDIISVLDGTVIEITNNDILGNTIKIRHSNDLVTIYQSLESINVKKDDTIMRGQVIGKSGTCKLYGTDYNLHFEVVYQGKIINPENSYNKTETELIEQ